MKKSNEQSGTRCRIAVIGGGASGLFAAIAAAQDAASSGIPVKIDIYEANTRVGKKILVTGNGRCNLSNRNISADFYRGSTELFESVYKQYTAEDTLAFFEGAGLFTRSDAAGRIYPMSNQASSVLDTLRNECRRLGIVENTDCRIISLKRENGSFLLNSVYRTDKVIVACGGMAAPVHGSDGSGYALLKKNGIAITRTVPALTAMNADGFTKALKGIRAEGAITLLSGGKTIASSSGEIQYTDYGISGIPAMQISRFAAYALQDGQEVFAAVDSLPSVSAEELTEKLIAIRLRDPERSLEDVLAGFMPKRLGSYLLSRASLSPSKSIGGVFDAALGKAAVSIKKTKYRIVSVRDYPEAQVTAGGVSAEEIDPNTLELKKMPGVYVCGEIADVDGDCGGYNLQWAFSSGAVAGKSIIRELKKCFA